MADEPRQQHQRPHSVSPIVIGGIVIMSLGTVVGAVVVAVMRPDSLPIIGAITAFMIPTIGGLMMVAVGQSRQVTDLELKVDGRLSDLIASNKLADNAQGRADERGGVPVATTPELEAAKAAEIQP